MLKQPTYEQLKQKNTELKKQLSDIEQSKKQLQELEKTFKNFINLSPDPIVIVQGFKFQIVNSAFTKMFGYDQKDVDNGLDFSAIVQKKDRKAARKIVKDRVSGKRFQKDHRTNFVTKLGEIIPCVTTATLIQHQDGPADLIIIRNISKRLTGKKALKESEENFKALADNANDGILVGVGDGVIVYANERIAKILGYTLKQLQKKRVKELIHPDEYPKIAEHYRKTLQGISPKAAYESIAIRKDGKSLPVEITGGKTTWKGQPADITIVRDITERKDSEKELKKRERELENKNLTLEELNCALNVLLDKRAQDKTEHEEKMVSNIKELVIPYLAELRKRGSKIRKETFAEIVERNLEDIISSDFASVSPKYLNLTPTEIKVVDLVKQGHKTKAIAEILECSPHTISNHKKSIRKKLNLTERKQNLTAYIQSLL